MKIKQLGAIVFCYLLVHGQLLALSGGPFDNNFYGPESFAGTYQASFTGKNTIGFVIFGVGTASDSFGRYAAFQEGRSSFGFSSGMVDGTIKEITCVMFAAQSEGNSDTPDGAIELPVESEGSGAWQATIFESSPIVRFEGEGSYSSSALVESTNTTTTVETRTSTDAVGNTTISIVETINESDTAMPNESVRIHVIGQRTSTAAPAILFFPAAANTTSDPDGGGGGTEG